MSDIKNAARRFMQDLRYRMALFEAGEPIIECRECESALLRHGECPACGWILPKQPTNQKGDL